MQSQFVNWHFVCPNVSNGIPAANGNALPASAETRRLLITIFHNPVMTSARPVPEYQRHAQRRCDV
jgi:hypothetical protein